MYHMHSAGRGFDGWLHDEKSRPSWSSIIFNVYINKHFQLELRNLQSKGSSGSGLGLRLELTQFFSGAWPVRIGSPRSFMASFSWLAVIVRNFIKKNVSIHESKLHPRSRLRSGDKH